MGGVVVLLAGDFRQTLPVIERGIPADEMNACFKASPLWATAEKLRHITNMRVHLYNDVESGAYAHQLLESGEGLLEIDVRGMIEFTNNVCNVVSLGDELIANGFPSLQLSIIKENRLWERTILASKDNSVAKMNKTF
ncbi:hypothetical protein PR048_004457 [Dryococelus australis]|uniref:ATP-dependent DNA helicase n=1 Tax=Dryococelus australis TaxID=614101 RepID=A0ABQ9I5J8_9NEOP|nr:hypothetical protein PR048_004457 [Dryococelus australis]